MLMSGFGKWAKKGDTNLQPSFVEMTNTLCLTLYFLVFYKKHGKDNKSKKKKKGKVKIDRKTLLTLGRMHKKQ